MEFQNSYDVLKEYCESRSFRGWDPYDGLNSKVFQSIPFIRDNRISRLAWIQLFKRSPINLRRIMLVPEEINDKGIGLFLSGYCKEFQFNPSDGCLRKIELLSSDLLKSGSTKYSGTCWGYNFDWQARAFFQPKNTPTVVASTFVANALLDAYEITGTKQLLTTARSTCDFILYDLNRTIDDKGGFAFSYSPLDDSVVFNASLLGSRLLARVYSFTNDNHLIEEAKKSVEFCCEHQRSNGSWSYGTLPFHQWIDNFHTGYNIECISDYMKFSADFTYNEQLERGFAYYIGTFFSEDGISKYYDNSTYPIDIHAPAQLVITLAKLHRFSSFRPLVDKVLTWTIDNMQSEKGYFYYQITRTFSSKLPYMRWAQAWMFYALSTYLHERARN